MGRNSTGAVTTSEIRKIELKFLIRDKILTKGKHTWFMLSWTSGDKINCMADYTTDRPYLRLLYTVTDNYTGEKTEHDYKIYLITAPSNLGKGKILYFLCPQTGRKCRILYKCYGSKIWKSRTAYQYRIYYPSQISSKFDFYNTRYWELDRQLSELLKSRRYQTTYNNRKTKFGRRLEDLYQQMEHYDMMRWQPCAMPQKLRCFSLK